jgi:polysaccharide export outer membrane protein
MQLTKLIHAILLGALIVTAQGQEARKAVAVPQESEASSYRLRAGDTVEIRVFHHDELSVRGPIAADGSVALQFIQSVPVAGLTPVQASARIVALYADGWLKKPQVAVNVLEYCRASITVSGQVNRPGTFTLPRNRSMTLLEAIGTAGHFNTRANQRSVLLKRGDKTWELNVKQILKNPRTDVPLRDGDIIWVKESIL